MEIDELEVLCRKIRQGLENARAYKPMGCFDLLESFPGGCCKISAFIVMYCLNEYMSLRKKDFVLLANAQIGKASHAWSRYRNINIDLTADQFARLNRPKVIVSTDNPWPGVDCSVFPYHKEAFNSEWYKKLVCTCEFVKSNMGLQSTPLSRRD